MRVLLTCLSESRRCPRLVRLLPYLAAHDVCVIDTLGTPAWQIQAKSLATRAGALLRIWTQSKRHAEAYLGRRIALQPGDQVPDSFDVVISFDLLLLPFLFKHFPGARIVLDAREWYPGQFTNSLKWRLTWGRQYHLLCRKYLRRVAALTTVSAGLAKLYRRGYGVTGEVLHSYCEASGLRPSPVGAPIRLVHHGNATRHRSLENMIECVERLGAHYRLDLILAASDPVYLRELEARVSRVTNVRLLPERPREELVEALNSYDIGLFAPPASTQNLRYSLPNKLFEYVQARLMVVVSPLADAASLVEESGLGVVASAATGNALADCIGQIGVDAIAAAKRRVDWQAKRMHARNYATGMLRIAGITSQSQGNGG